MKTKNKTAATNIGLAIVGQTVVNSTLVILIGFCAKVEQTFFKCPTCHKPYPLVANEKTV
jgi:hypothetical protein